MKNLEEIFFFVGEQEEGERLDRVLTVEMEEVSRSQIQKILKTDGVLVNGIRVYDKNHRMTLGDEIAVHYAKPVPLDVQPEDIPLTIVYEDEDLLVVDKSKGMVVHPAPGNATGTLVNAILFHCEGRLSSINGLIRSGIVHRIDKDTSGLLMVAKTDAAHQRLADQLAAHEIIRRYQGVAYHEIASDQGTIEGPIGRDPKNRKRMAVTERNGKPAVTHYRVLERFSQFTYLEARLETGRTHQIRVHMAHIGHPLVGDPLYGPKRLAFDLEGQLLHAKVLGFHHPRTGDYMEFDSPLPEEFSRILGLLQKKTAGR